MSKDCTPISQVNDEKLQLFINHQVSNHLFTTDYSFQSSITMQSKWIHILINNYQLFKTYLLESIVNSDPLRISSDR